MAARRGRENGGDRLCAQDRELVLRSLRLVLACRSLSPRYLGGVATSWQQEAPS